MSNAQLQHIPYIFSLSNAELEQMIFEEVQKNIQCANSITIRRGDNPSSHTFLFAGSGRVDHSSKSTVLRTQQMRFYAADFNDLADVSEQILNRLFSNHSDTPKFFHISACIDNTNVDLISILHIGDVVIEDEITTGFSNFEFVTKKVRRVVDQNYINSLCHVDLKLAFS